MKPLIAVITPHDEDVTKATRALRLAGFIVIGCRSVSTLVQLARYAEQDEPSADEPLAKFLRSILGEVQ